MPGWHAANSYDKLIQTVSICRHNRELGVFFHVVVASHPHSGILLPRPLLFPLAMHVISLPSQIRECIARELGSVTPG